MRISEAEKIKNSRAETGLLTRLKSGKSLLSQAVKVSKRGVEKTQRYPSLLLRLFAQDPEENP